MIPVLASLIAWCVVYLLVGWNGVAVFAFLSLIVIAIVALAHKKGVPL